MAAARTAKRVASKDRPALFKVKTRTGIEAKGRRSSRLALQHAGQSASGTSPVKQSQKSDGKPLDTSSSLAASSDPASVFSRAAHAQSEMTAPTSSMSPVKLSKTAQPAKRHNATVHESPSKHANARHALAASYVFRGKPTPMGDGRVFRAPRSLEKLSVPSASAKSLKRNYLKLPSSEPALYDSSESNSVEPDSEPPDDTSDYDVGSGSSESSAELEEPMDVVIKAEQSQAPPVDVTRTVPGPERPIAGGTASGWETICGHDSLAVSWTSPELSTVVVPTLDKASVIALAKQERVCLPCVYLQMLFDLISLNGFRKMKPVLTCLTPLFELVKTPADLTGFQATVDAVRRLFNDDGISNRSFDNLESEATAKLCEVLRLNAGQNHLPPIRSLQALALHIMAAVRTMENGPQDDARQPESLVVNGMSSLIELVRMLEDSPADCAAGTANDEAWQQTEDILLREAVTPKLLVYIGLERLVALGVKLGHAARLLLFCQSHPDHIA
ncbi:uncharacterized protein L969DRAFT_96687 [Mixia osmundae IAM 14324]|uniref:Uncharacterized protein n=1 Tax=Mixia osmundae (strain CBS 9802 / IAM 14324 / JCM 22182 / KY 12970) TaxID=764103 RepID=G7DSV3_MIXOS|nr:uncharacterized protein L969DRAFT_96687 [Mixia osmundae IAM 14324]KEI37119.1 hypothetical protein L969DRAFT_96687 [Mixia osmundae IAM 14324]GAA93663.1 hypothetical protein E5Q_00308 [Mixia osmundae IAM 14324]